MAWCVVKHVDFILLYITLLTFMNIHSNKNLLEVFIMLKYEHSDRVNFQCFDLFFPRKQC